MPHRRAEAERRRWKKTSATDWYTVVDDVLHCATCGVPLRDYVYRHKPTSERCISLTWCPTCRTYFGTMVHVPLREDLPDALATLDEYTRERLLNNETKLMTHIDKQINQGTWP